MAINGYGLTLAGSTTGSITGIESITVGGLELDFDEIATVADTNRVVENLPGKVREGPLTVTIAYAKTLYNACRNAVLAQTSQTWTLTDSGSSTHAGTGYVQSVSGKNLDTNGHATFRLTIRPATKWTFTA